MASTSWFLKLRPIVSVEAESLTDYCRVWKCGAFNIFLQHVVFAVHIPRTYTLLFWLYYKSALSNLFSILPVFSIYLFYQFSIYRLALFLVMRFRTFTSNNKKALPVYHFMLAACSPLLEVYSNNNNTDFCPKASYWFKVVCHFWHHSEKKKRKNTTVNQR